MSGSELAAAAHGAAHAAKHGTHVSAPEETWLHFLYVWFGIPDWLAVSLLIGLLLVVLFWRMSKRLSLYPSGFQTLWEMAVEFFESLCKSAIGHGGEKYAPLIGSFFIYILLLNLVGLIPGFMSPTAHPYITIGLAVASLTIVHAIAIKELGLKNYLLHYVDRPFPNPIVNAAFNIVTLAPIVHLVGEFSKLISLSIRLFGNIFGEDTVIFQFASLGMITLHAFGLLPNPVTLPLPFQLPVVLLHVLVAFIQAFVFSSLTSVYIALFVSGHENAHDGEHAAHEAAH
ncbi:MAG: F0F1 ATP synthase subunit A [Armatimonadetes bacterium]|nr:F0F1 ATP synthase subunit A [Armatimonadota bacterium]MCX7967788.1 F0F1 ATP synthase subunit A [Armatimonadota bacterium]MDW8144280.1 F0F1 ATP synthase subunit A [Armatimonadota bacterium]